MAEITEFINRVGFPVFVAVYLLIRLEPTISRLSDNIRLLTILLAKQEGVNVDDIKRKYGNGR